MSPINLFHGVLSFSQSLRKAAKFWDRKWNWLRFDFKDVRNFFFSLCCFFLLWKEVFDWSLNCVFSELDFCQINSALKTNCFFLSASTSTFGRSTTFSVFRFFSSYLPIYQKRTVTRVIEPMNEWTPISRWSSFNRRRLHAKLDIWDWKIVSRKNHPDSFSLKNHKRGLIWWLLTLTDAVLDKSSL